jgi:hypothetical protein
VGLGALSTITVLEARRAMRNGIRYNRTAQQRFDEKWVLDPDSGCHLWTAAIQEHGYGKIKHAGRMARAHRVAWELAHGPIPREMRVLHKCDVRRCVLVDHLFLGTAAQNSADMVIKGRQMRGESHVFAKLTDAQVAEIRAEYAAGGVTQKQLAVKRGCSRECVGLIVRGQRRKK